jgi:hypothetical protein
MTISADESTGRVAIAHAIDPDSDWASLDALDGLYEAPAVVEEGLQRAI